MNFLYFLENLRVPVVNEFMLAITYFGDEIAFLVAALILFWCVDKRKGYYILAVGFIGTMANQFMKLWFRIPRPWVLDENFTILEQAREAASGYSFPSGHSQSAVGTFGGIAATMKNKIVRVVAIVIAVLVPFSRMYIGVHTPYDVVVSILIALALVFSFRKPVMEAMKGIIALCLVMALGLLCYVEWGKFPADMDPENLGSGMKNAYTMLGCLIGMAIVYLAEGKYVKFETKAIWWAQILKVVLGVAVVLLVKEGLRSPLEALFGVYPGRAVRYFLVVVTAGVLWPMSFRWFSRLGVKK